MAIKKQNIKSSVLSLSGNDAGVAFYSSRSWWTITICKVYRDDPLHLNDAQENKSLCFLLLDHLVTDLHDHPFFFSPTPSCDLESADQPWVSCGLFVSSFLFSLLKEIIGWCPFAGRGRERWILVCSPFLQSLIYLTQMQEVKFWWCA